jgi:hypothetical protein
MRKDLSPRTGWEGYDRKVCVLQVCEVSCSFKICRDSNDDTSCFELSTAIFFAGTVMTVILGGSAWYEKCCCLYFQ